MPSSASNFTKKNSSTTLFSKALAALLEHIFQGTPICDYFNIYVFKNKTFKTKKAYIGCAHFKTRLASLDNFLRYYETISFQSVLLTWQILNC